jgi:hypothetical protein
MSGPGLPAHIILGRVCGVICSEVVRAHRMALDDAERTLVRLTSSPACPADIIAPVKPSPPGQSRHANFVRTHTLRVQTASNARASGVFGAGKTLPPRHPGTDGTGACL